MGIEIERKFLVNKELWNEIEKPVGKHYCQGYLVNGDGRNVRIRVAGDQSYITIKGPTKGFSRSEYEYAIPKNDAEEMLTLFAPKGTEKIRYRIPAGGGLTWEVDEFVGDNKGLIVAEIELQHEQQQFEKPKWLDKEVTEDRRYSNSNLATNPYSEWNAFQ